ncbi:hypothetical protein L218DRAFT_954704 [Marasmius fiardii PR-910]|nr:hypothetical protein L218DRAFT_954704 [Marasmius fiardii PR-910]
MFPFLALIIAFAVSTAYAAPATLCSPDIWGRSISIVTKSGNMEWGWGSGQNSAGLQYQAVSNEVGEFNVYPVLDPSLHSELSS